MCTAVKRNLTEYYFIGKVGTVPGRRTRKPGRTLMALSRPTPADRIDRKPADPRVRQYRSIGVYSVYTYYLPLLDLFSK